MLKILRIIWELPQIILSGITIFTLLLFNKMKEHEKFKDSTIIYMNSQTIFFSLGKFIFISANGNYSNTLLKHEYGHSIQSKYLGPLYLIVVGIPSVLMNILTRMNILKGGKYYYKRWPENWADSLGKVER